MADRVRSHVLPALHAASLVVLLPVVVLGRPAHAPALLLLPLGWLMLMLARRPLALRSPLNLPLLAIALGMAVSLFATYDVAWSYPKVAGLVFGIALFLAFLAWGESEAAWRRLATGFAIAGAGVAAIALVATAWPAKIPFLTSMIERLPRLPWLLPGAEEGIHPNEVAGTLLWTTPFAGCMALGLWIEALHRRGGRGWASALAVLAFSVAAVLLPLGVLILSQSRGGLFGLAAAGAVAAVGITPRRARLITLLVVIALIIGAAYLWQGAGVQGALPELAPVAASTGTLEFRLGVWAQAIKGIEDFTLSGMGMNVFRQAVHVLYPTPLIDPAFNLGHAHNIFLQTALDLGLIGLVGFAGLWIGALAMVGKSWKSGSRASSSSFLRLAAVGLASSLIGYLVYGLLDAVALGARPGFLWWALIGLVGGLYRLEHANPDASERTASNAVLANGPAQRSSRAGSGSNHPSGLAPSETRMNPWN